MEFNGWTKRHWTAGFQGERFSLVFFIPTRPRATWPGAPGWLGLNTSHVVIVRPKVGTSSHAQKLAKVFTPKVGTTQNAQKLAPKRMPKSWHDKSDICWPKSWSHVTRVCMFVCVLTLSFFFSLLPSPSLSPSSPLPLLLSPSPSFLPLPFPPRTEHADRMARSTSRATTRVSQHRGMSLQWRRSARSKQVPKQRSISQQFRWVWSSKAEGKQQDGKPTNPLSTRQQCWRKTAWRQTNKADRTQRETVDPC